jgi:hypothetical protein
MRDTYTVHWQQHINRDYIHLEDYKREVQRKRVFSSGNVHEPVKEVPSPVAKRDHGLQGRNERRVHDSEATVSDHGHSVNRPKRFNC